jgi:hypothetical protein
LYLLFVIYSHQENSRITKYLILEESNHLILPLAQLNRCIPFLHLTSSVLQYIPLELLSEIFFVGGITVISKMNEPKNLAIKCIFNYFFL